MRCHGGILISNESRVSGNASKQNREHQPWPPLNSFRHNPPFCKQLKRNMKTKSILLCLGAAAVVDGWSVCSPTKRIIQKRLLKKGLLVGAATGAVVAGTAVTAAGAAVAYNQLNNREVYEPAAGSMSKCLHTYDTHRYLYIVSVQL